MQAAVAGGGVGDALAVHQHQALRRLGAANKNPRQTATPTGWRNLHARHAAEQVGDAGGLQAVDVGAGEYSVGGAAVITRLDLAVGADNHVGELQGLVAGVGEQVGAGKQ